MMSNKESKTENANQKILENNSNVSTSVVTQYRKLEKELKELGVDTKPHYTLSPLLGRVVSNAPEK